MHPQDWTKDDHPKWATVADLVIFVSRQYWRVTKWQFRDWPGTVGWRGQARLLLVDEVIAHFDEREARLRPRKSN